MSHATATKTAAKKPAKKKVSAFSTRKVDPAYYWMVVPAAIIFAFFLYLPFLDGVKYSFTNSQGYGDYKFIGLKNYIALFQDNRVGHAYLFTFLIAILITVLINVIALFLSVLLNSKIAFKNGFRAIFFNIVHRILRAAGIGKRRAAQTDRRGIRVDIGGERIARRARANAQRLARRRREWSARTRAPLRCDRHSRSPW